MGSPCRILSIDGGGIRGVIPAMVLAEIERRARLPICKLFELVAGTSTGGILALGLTKPNVQREPEHRAADLIDLYAGEGPRIFDEEVWHRLRAAGGMLDERYPSSGIEAVLDRYFGDSRLSEALTDVVVTAYEIEQRTPWFFRSLRAKEHDNYNFPMKDVARATSAAPTYFEPLKLQTGADVDYWTLVDGGVFANNPTLCALADAKTMLHAEDILVVSLGTGVMTRRIPYEQASDWGLMGWARPILDIVFDGVSDTVDYQAKQLCPPVGGRKRYYRFQVTLTSDRDQRMDDPSASHIHALKLLAEDMIDTHQAELDELCSALAAGVPASA